jgi:hypothetical protein
MKSLYEIAVEHDTDKAAHGYCEVYEKAFNHLRSANIKILEIGVFYGASLRTWRDYFVNAEIHGIDLDVERCGTIDDVTLHQLNVDNTLELEKLSNKFGPFDIIIDDASHTMKHQQKTFNTLWPKLAPGGYFVIEDIHTSFLPKLEGHSPCALDEHNKTTTYKMVECLKEKKSWSGRHTKKENFEEVLNSVEHVTIWVRNPTQFSHELSSNDNSATSIIKKKI